MSSPVLPRRPASRQLADLLVGLTGMLHRLRTAPAGHPSLVAQAQAVERAVAVALDGRERLLIEVGTVQLVVDGMETNPEYEPLRDLASELREAGIAALELLPGLAGEEVLEAFGPLAREEGGVRRTAHLVPQPRVVPPSPETAWLELERAVLAEPWRAAAQRGAHELALGLELAPADPARDGEVLRLLTRVAGAATEAGGSDAATHRSGGAAAEVLALLAAIPLPALRRLLAPTTDQAVLARFLRTVAPLLTPRLMLRFLEVLAQGREHRLSAGALRVLARLAVLAEERESVRRALGEELLRFGESETPLPPANPVALEPERVLKLALESGILEPGTLAAAERMITRRQVAPLLTILDTVPREHPVARALRGRVYRPLTVKAVLEGAAVDLDALDRLVPAAGLEAVPALLEALTHSRDRRVRLQLLDLLARYGSTIGPLVVERLDGMPWYVQRNLLSLLGRLPALPPEFRPLGHLAHRDPRVRHEAIALAIATPALRTRAVTEALDSLHEPTLRLGLTALAECCPPELVPRLLARVGNVALDPELRAMAVTALAPVPDSVVLRLLRRLVVARGIAGLGRLAPRSPMMLAALRGLATHWHTHPKVATLLDAAQHSRDPEIQSAGRPPARRSGARPGVAS